MSLRYVKWDEESSDEMDAVLKTDINVILSQLAYQIKFPRAAHIHPLFFRPFEDNGSLGIILLIQIEIRP